MKRLAWVLILAAFHVAGAAASDEPAAAPGTLEELDRRIGEAAAASNAPGLQVAIVDAGGASWTRAYGHIDREKTRPVSDDSVFRAGSISKSFTGVLAMMLVEDGVLDLDETLRTAAPEVAFQNQWEETDPVRLVDLSEHTTGWDDVQFSEYRDFGPDAELLDGISFNPKSRTSRWKPGTYASYNNAGPAILGYVMEKKTGRRFDDLMADRIFEPLGMKNCSFLLTDGVKAKLSNSYSGDGSPEPYVHIGMRPSGSLNCPAAELAKFVALLIRRGEWNGVQLVSPEGVARIETPTRSLAARNGLSLGYGLGVHGAPTRSGGVFYGHNGGIDGFLAEYGYLRDAGLGFVFMMNSPDSELYEQVSALVIGYLRTQRPIPPAASPVEGIDLGVYEGFYRQMTPRSEFTRVLTDAFDIVRVEERDGVLVVGPAFGSGGAPLAAFGGGLFAREGAAEPDRIFIATGDRMEMIRGLQDAYLRVGAVSAFAPLSLLAATAFSGALAFFTTLVWCLLRPFGLFMNSNRWRAWLWPYLGFIALIAIVAAFGLGASGGFSRFIANMGGPSAYTLTIAAATLALPVFAALGLLAALAAPRVAFGARLLAGVASLTLAALSLYLWNYGWIGMTLWSYPPQVPGQ
ncbi:MAG: beta-lactamase family protein [Parvularculaceae bacterium]|nr:beta-lactamase family protein [Parvularculaceae bacterium]